VSATKLTREGALLWLNDRLGRQAQLTVMIGPDSAWPAARATAVAWSSGPLEHWREVVPTDLWRLGEDEDSSGVYKVGTGGLNLSSEIDGALTGPVDGAPDVDVLYVPIDASVAVYLVVDGDA
jgi:hypothetical protein